MAQKGLWNLARNKAMQDRGGLPGEEGEAFREYEAMHEENFLSSSWLREDGEDKREKEIEVDRVPKEEVSKKRKRVWEKEEDGTVIVKRKCVKPLTSQSGRVFGVW